MDWKRLEARYAKMEWQQRHAWQGLAVQLLGDDAAPIDGICRGADDDGALLLETGTGVQRILSGDVSLRPVPPGGLLRGAGSTLGVRRA